MSKLYCFILGLLFLFSCNSKDYKSSFLLTSKNEEFINSMLNNMTVEEKVGQTCQITLDAVLMKDTLGILLEPHQIDKKKLESAILDYKIGSILNVSNRTFSLEKMA